MKKIIIIDLKNLRNENELIYRFYKALNYFPHMSEQERIENIKKNKPVVWHAFEDDMSLLDIKEDGKRIDELLFILTNIEDLLRRLSYDRLSSLLVTFSYLTDPAQRIDGINFFFQIRFKDYEPIKEELHTKLHRGLPGGKDINN